MEYLTGALERRSLTAAVGRRALVLGSGRGLLARGLARPGFDVVAVDPSSSATAMAQEAEGREGRGITYKTAVAEELGSEYAEFDLAYYADTFEITPRLRRVLGEATRVLKPGGMLVYDTVNRTLLSRLINLGAFPGAAHDQDRDFTPKDPRNLIKGVIARCRGKIADEEIAPLVDFVLHRDRG